MTSVADALTQRMNFLVQRQGVISSNIANANTPGYLAKDMVSTGDSKPTSGFGMVMTNAMHLNGGSAAPMAGKITEDTRFIQHNGNSVRLDDEMLKMTNTQLDYRMMTQLYTQQVAMQKVALGR